MSAEYGVTSGGTWGIFESYSEEESVEKVEVRNEDNQAEEQKALSKEVKKTWKCTLVSGETPPSAGEVLTVGTWSGIVDSVKKTQENGNHYTTYEVVASQRDAATLTAYSAPA